MKAESIENRFWSYVTKTETCWIWEGTTLESGYGQFYVCHPSVRARAHRFSYQKIKGPIPKGLQLDHLCRNRICVNPSHLEAVTGRENLMRSNSFVSINAKKTHCYRGHPLIGSNLNINPNGARRCRKCGAINQSKYRMEKCNGKS